MGRCVAASMGRHNFPGSVIGANHGGLVKGVALLTASDLAGAPAGNSPTAVIIDDLMEKAFDDNHLLSLVPIKDSAAAAFFSSETLYAPLVFEDPERSADAAQLSKLPHVLIASRWAHYLQLKLRALIGSQQSAREVERGLQSWADRWVLTQTEGVSEALKARQPLRDIKIEVFDKPGQPGHLDARVELVPHFRVGSFRAVLVLKGGAGPAKADGPN
jgi:type VI secretion system protein ImpC